MNLDLQEAWEQYKRTDDPAIRSELVEEYLKLVRNVAGRMAMSFPKSVEINDLISTGVIGLTEAVRNFDPSRGVKFETFAVPRIRGAILDELRALDWVPRSTRAKSRHLEKATIVLENKLGRNPSVEELAMEMNVTPKEVHTTRREISNAPIQSLDELICREDNNRQVARIETVGNATNETILEKIEKQELKEYVLDAINFLTEQEKLVIALYYYEELTLKEIGEIMQISESRVSQIHTKAVLRLRNMIKDKFNK